MDAFPGLPGFLRFVVTLLVVFVPLGMWKAVEIIVWLFKNVSVSVGG